MDTEVRDLVEKFVSDLMNINRTKAMQMLNGVYSENIAGTASRARVPRPTVEKATKGRGPKAKAKARAAGQKRDPEELAKLVEGLAEYITKNPGQNIEAIGKGMSQPTKDLTLPVAKLLASKRISRKGQKRATKYFARESN